jgi:hypothetical protein
LVEETGVPGKKNDLPQITDNLYHIMLYQVHPSLMGFKLATLVVIGIDYIGSCKSNYHTFTHIKATTLDILVKFSIELYIRHRVETYYV